MDARVMLCGNLGCVAYTYAKYLRRKGIDVNLYLWKWELEKDPRNPLKQDPDLKELPEWIGFFSNKKNLFLEHRRAAKDFDIVHAFNTTPIYAQFTGKRFISHPCGSDAREYAFGGGIHPRLLRRAYRKNDAFFLGQCDYYENVLPKLNVKNPVFIPPIVPDNIKIAEGKAAEREGVEELFFHPTSHIHRTKGNDLLIKAFGRYVKKYKPSAKLVMVDWGDEVEQTKQLISKLDISDFIVMKKWMSKEAFFQYVRDSDIIFDQFKVPSSSTIQREACALGKPVIKYMDENWYKAYDEMPFISAGTEEEIYQLFERYHEDPKMFVDVGIRAKEIMKRNNDWRAVTDKIIAVYENILD